MEQSRWYYNALVSCVKALYSNNKILERNRFSDYQIRDILSDFIYKEEIQGENIIQSFIQKQAPSTTQFCPPWWSNIHTRLPRGVAKKMTQNLNSIITNFKNGNIKKFNLQYKSRKHSNTEFVMFEDSNFPAFLREIKSQYWYTNKNGKKQRSSLSELIKQTKPRGIEITYDKRTDKYFFSYPVDYDFFPSEDRRNENQETSEPGEKIIIIDPGVRKFGVGYDPNGKIVVFGEGANKELVRLLLILDKEKDYSKQKLYWKKIHDLTEELHWKIISYLIKNYDLIMMSEFRISSMVKGHKLSRQTKRLLYMFRHYSFIQKLKYKVQVHNKKLYLVDEIYTSKTCTNCGNLKMGLGSSEKYNCESCGISIDRDVNGSRNIYIKNIKAR
jgi:putative transposase